MGMKYGISDSAGFTVVTGKPEPSSVAHDNVDEMEGGFGYMEGSGTQISEHPAKNQPKTMRPLG